MQPIDPGTPDCYSTSTSETIRVGIIGAGANPRRNHIPGLQAIDAVEVVVVVNRTPESGRRVAEEFKIPRVADSRDQIVRDNEIDAVVIGIWPYVHGVTTVAALENGKNVLLPLSVVQPKAYAAVRRYLS